MQADREDITFQDVVQGEALTFMVAILNSVHWYPGTLHYVSHYHRLPFFVRAAQHKHFKKLAAVIGIESGSELRDKFVDALKESGIHSSRDFFRMDFLSLLNMNNLDSLK